MFMYDYVKSRLQRTHLLKTNKPRGGMPIITNNIGNNSEMHEKPASDMLTNSNTRSSLIQFRGSQHSDVTKESLEKTLNSIHMELDHIVSECNNKVDNVRSTIVEMEHTIGFPN